MVTLSYIIFYFLVDQFSVGDIVWAKYYQEPYWPAQVSLIYFVIIVLLTTYFVVGGGAVASWLVRSSPDQGPGSSPGLVFFGKTLTFHSASLHPGV